MMSVKYSAQFVNKNCIQKPSQNVPNKICMSLPVDSK